MTTAHITRTTIAPGDLVTVHILRNPRGDADAYTGIVWRNRPDVGLDITEDGRTLSGWSWNIIARVERH